MILDLGEDAKEYGRQALRAFEAAGGDQLVQQAEAKPDTRDALVGPVLNELGAWELDARTDADGLEAAAALCRSAGYWAVPYPVAERLARPVDLDVDGLIVVADNRPSGAIGGVESRWAAVTLDGARSTVVGRGLTGPAFVTELELSAIDRNGAGDVALGLVLPCWTLLGMLDRAMELTIAHVSLRKQFGQTAVDIPGRPVPAHRRRSRTQRRGDPRQVRAVERRHQSPRGTRRRSRTADVGHRSCGGGLPGVPSTARRGRIL